MKKGVELATNTMVLIIISLIVLAIIVLVLRQQITKGAEKYTAIGKEAEINTTKCSNIILGRACSDTACDTSKGFTEEYSPTGKWDDCGGKHCCVKS